jgi:hypothetical protein
MSLDPKVRAWIESLDNASLMFSPELRMLRDAFFEAERERDAVTRLMIQPSIVTSPPNLFDALLPNECSMLGFAWHCDLTETEAIAAVRKAAGLEDA